MAGRTGAGLERNLSIASARFRLTKHQAAGKRRKVVSTG